MKKSDILYQNSLICKCAKNERIFLIQTYQKL